MILLCLMFCAAAKFHDPLFDDFCRITAMEMATPRVCWVSLTIFQQNLFRSADRFGWHTCDQGVWWHIAIYRTVRANKRALPDCDAG